MSNSEAFKDLTACFQAAMGAYHTTEMRTEAAHEKNAHVITCATALFKKVTGRASLELTPVQEARLKRALLVSAGAAGKNPWVGYVTSDDILKARDFIYDKAVASGLITRAPQPPRA